MLTLGQTVMTRGVSIHCNEDPDAFMRIMACLSKHASGDWGEVCAEDKESNDQALKDGDRILSAYTINGRKIWIITEWDRSVTTVLFPEEY
jgi:hypothetical protein